MITKTTKAKTPKKDLSAATTTTRNLAVNKAGLKRAQAYFKKHPEEADDVKK
jgi:hypothetical protein